VFGGSRRSSSLHFTPTTTRKFLTKDLISSYGAEPLRGRGTRVFEAIEIDEHGCEKGPAVVLKDIWIDHDRMREGAILTQLCDEAEDEDKKLVKKLFLTTVCHGDTLNEAGRCDDTENGLMRGLQTVTDSFDLQQKPLATSKHEAGSGSQGLRATSLLHIPCSSTTYTHKVHYRIVFEEKGETIDRIESLSEVVKILIEIVGGVSSSDHP
jgi:hypothetical protein